MYDPNTNLETALIINTLSKVSLEYFECTVGENNIAAPKSKKLNCPIFSNIAIFIVLLFIFYVYWEKTNKIKIANF